MQLFDWNRLLRNGAKLVFFAELSLSLSGGDFKFEPQAACSSILSASKSSLLSLFRSKLPTDTCLRLGSVLWSKSVSLDLWPIIFGSAVRGEKGTNTAD